MEFNFSHLYKSETVNVKDTDGKVIFTARVKEISHGAKTEAQNKLMAEIDIPMGGSKSQRKRKMESSMKKAMKNGVSGKVSMFEELAAIEEWTLQDNEGNNVPVCQEAWTALPAGLVNQITEAIERLNPDLDDEFRNDDADESAD